MNRRSFFKSMVGGVATAAAVRTFPFRVFSFPSQPRLSSYPSDWREWGVHANKLFNDDFEQDFPIGSTVRIRIPQRFAINPSHMLVDREALTVESWDAQSGTMRLRIPGRSEHPFTGIVTG